MSIRTVSPPAPRAAREPSAAGLDVDRLRADFPLLDQRVHGKPLVYFDNAATAQKPRAALDAVRRYYERDNANVHRGVHQLSERATRNYEEARVKVQRFLNAADVREIIFVRGTTEAINLVAQTYGRRQVGPGDEILITHLEHHSNIVPWQLLCEEKGAVLRVVPINDRGELLLDEYEKLLTPRTRLVALAHVSNSLGTVNPVRRIIELAHKAGVPVLLDGAQAVPHLAVDVRALDCDFYAFSGHKVYGPTGIGVLYGKAGLLEAMPPWQGGGDMISSVTFAKTTYNDLPYKFEAGTPNIAGAIGLGAALDYVTAIGLDAIAAHEHALLEYATAQMQALPGIRIVGTAADKAAVISFLAEDPPVFPLDLGTKLDLEGIAVRTGHHCCQPVMDRFGTSGTARASFALYNTRAEVDRLVAALRGILAEATERPRPTVSLPLAPRSEPAYPKAAVASPEAAAEELADVFDFLDDWTERYQYIIELGQKIPPLPDEFRTEPNRVHGCQSTVYLSARKRPGTADVLEFLADSDADIVRGLIALLERVYSGQKASAVLAFDIDKFWKRLGLSQNLSSGRRNGLAGMVQRIRAHAAKLAGAKPGSEPGGTR
jgi:cysteine desulfurase/selenocysteine lyase